MHDFTFTGQCLSSFFIKAAFGTASCSALGALRTNTENTPVSTATSDTYTYNIPTETTQNVWP